MTDLATVDYSTDSSLTGAAADYSGDWSGTGGGGPPAAHDYEPYVFDANASEVDVVAHRRTIQWGHRAATASPTGPPFTFPRNGFSELRERCRLASK